ncbi:MAG: pilus assembly protein PilM [Candidatus Omnitrophica bacterium]|nr:pilus assembly protein PilM [Candidatus Omnitrophota bacterium]
MTSDKGYTNIYTVSIHPVLNMEQLKQYLPISQIKGKVKTFLSGNNFLKTKDEVSVGINIGNRYLKGLVLRQGRIADYFLELNQDLPVTLKKIWSERKISARTVKVSVKNPSCLVRYFPFPKMEKKKLEQALFYELNKHIPFSPEEVFFDYYILKDISPGEVMILLALAKKDFINSILEAFKPLGLAVSEINLDSICLINLFLDRFGDNKESNACILDIGSSFSVMTIINKGMPFITRDVKFSTKEIVEIAARTKGISPEEVEKELLGLNIVSEFLEIIQGSVSGLCKEMKSSFDYFEVNKGEHIDKLYLTGGLASIKGIEKIFAESLDTDVEVLPVSPTALKQFDHPGSDKKFNSLKSSLAVVFGLLT